MQETTELVKQLAQLLTDSSLMVATAESCTGGGVAAAFTDLVGSSAWFDSGFVTYSNAAKMRMLNVSAETLATHGAVSEATVCAMVRGAVNNSLANVAVAISGVAGPGGGSIEKPVGTVWFAWGNAENQHAQGLVFKGDRKEIRKQAVTYAIQGLVEWLLKNNKN